MYSFLDNWYSIRCVHACNRSDAAVWRSRPYSHAAPCNAFVSHGPSRHSFRALVPRPTILIHSKALDSFSCILSGHPPLLLRQSLNLHVLFKQQRWTAKMFPDAHHIDVRPDPVPAKSSRSSPRPLRRLIPQQLLNQVDVRHQHAPAAVALAS